MEAFIGTKRINAKPMTRLEYNKFRGWELPDDENGDDAGMLVEYTDGGKGNTVEFKGYVSWSPLDVFNRAYTPIKGMTFGEALQAMKTGQKVCRAGWNGKGKFIFLASGSTPKVNRPTLPGIYPEDTGITGKSHIAIKTTDGRTIKWSASQSDILATDWMVYSGN